MAKQPLNAGFTGDIAPENSVTTKARSAIHKARDEAGMVAAHAVDHPAATSSAIAVVGLIGLAVGYALGAASSARAHRWYR